MDPGPSLGPGHALAPKMDLKFLSLFQAVFAISTLYIIHSLVPLTMLEHFFGPCGTLPRVRGPGTLLDLHGPQMDPVRLI